MVWKVIAASTLAFHSSVHLDHRFAPLAYRNSTIDIWEQPNRESSSPPTNLVFVGYITADLHLVFDKCCTSKNILDGEFSHKILKKKKSYRVKIVNTMKHESSLYWRGKHELYCWGWMCWCSRVESCVLTALYSGGSRFKPAAVWFSGFEGVTHDGGYMARAFLLPPWTPGSSHSLSWLPVCEDSFCLLQLDTGRPVDTGASGSQPVMHSAT